MRILFVDIDGVMVGSAIKEYNIRNRLSPNRFSTEALGLIRDLLSQLEDLHIVISSEWRLHKTLDSLKEQLIGHGATMKMISSILGATPHLENMTRGKEIQMWIQNATYKDGHQISHWAVLDDQDFNLDGVLNHLVKIDGKEGLTYGYMEEILETLGYVPPEEDSYAYEWDYDYGPPEEDGPDEEDDD